MNSKHCLMAHWLAGTKTPERRGLDGVRYGITRICSAFPDWSDKVLDIFPCGDRVVGRYVSNGTHLGPFRGLRPTGRWVEMEEISIYPWNQDGIVEQWCMFGELGRLQQLGVTPQQLEAILLWRSAGSEGDRAASLPAALIREGLTCRRRTPNAR